MLVYGQLPAGDRGAVHHHGGDEIIRVRSGRILFRVGEERRVCGAHDIAVIAPGVKHGFIVEEAAAIEVIAEQEMGSFYLVADPNGRQRVVEVFRDNVPWDRRPARPELAASQAQMKQLEERLIDQI